MSNRKGFSSDHVDVHQAEREPTVTTQDLSDARATDREHDDLTWSRGSNLDAPPARPGMVQNWIRYELGGKEDGPNLSKKLGPERWTPRRPNTVDAAYTPATIVHPQLGEIIAAAGMVLCERPIDIQAQRDRHYARVLSQQTEMIDQNLFKEQDSRMPLFKSHKSTVERVARRIAPD